MISIGYAGGSVAYLGMACAVLEGMKRLTKTSLIKVFFAGSLMLFAFHSGDAIARGASSSRSFASSAPRSGGGSGSGRGLLIKGFGAGGINSRGRGVSRGSSGRGSFALGGFGKGGIYSRRGGGSGGIISGGTTLRSLR